MGLKLGKTTALAAVIFGVALGAAAAQTAAPGGLAPDAIKAAIAATPKPTGAAGTGSGKLSGAVTPNFSSGEYLERCYTSVFYSSGGYYYQYAFNTDSTYLYTYINSPYTSSAASNLLNVCTGGELYYVVFDSSGNWYELQTK